MVTRNEKGTGQHPGFSRLSSEGLLGKSGASSVHHEGPKAEPTPAGPICMDDVRSCRREILSSRRREFQALGWRLRPDVELFEGANAGEALGRVRAEATKMDSRGMLLRLWLPSSAWLKELLIGRVSLRIGIHMPAVGGSVYITGHVAWVEALGGDNACSVGMIF